MPLAGVLGVKRIGAAPICPFRFSTSGICDYQARRWAAVLPWPDECKGSPGDAGAAGRGGRRVRDGGEERQ